MRNHRSWTLPVLLLPLLATAAAAQEGRAKASEAEIDAAGITPEQARHLPDSSILVVDGERITLGELKRGWTAELRGARAAMRAAASRKAETLREELEQLRAAEERRLGADRASAELARLRRRGRAAAREALAGIPREAAELARRAESASPAEKAAIRRRAAELLQRLDRPPR